jgi:hypothetical protein
LNFLNRFSKKVQISSFIKIRPVGAELLHADGQTDMTKLTVAFHNYVNLPKNSTYFSLQEKKWAYDATLYYHIFKVWPAHVDKMFHTPREQKYRHRPGQVSAG